MQNEHQWWQDAAIEEGLVGWGTPPVSHTKNNEEYGVWAGLVEGRCEQGSTDPPGG